jgi:hypothetical protein
MMTVNIVACAAAAGAALALLCLGAVALANRRLRRRCEALAAGTEALRAELVLATAQSAETAVAAAQRLQRLEQAHGRMADRLRLAERRADGRSFDLAIDSARRGEEPARLAADFGLSRGEAELVARMHGRR